MLPVIAGSQHRQHRGLKGGEGFALTNLYTLHSVHLSPVSALRTPCFMRGAAVFCGMYKTDTIDQVTQIRKWRL